MVDVWLVVQLLALAGFSVLAYSLRALDAKGSTVSFALGLMIILAGGLTWLALMAVFTGAAFVVTKFQMERKHQLGLAEARDGERGWKNVVGNGAAPGIAALAFWLEPDAGAIAYAVAVAAIMADTMGSEVGVLSRQARLAVPPWPRVEAGLNGAVSALGQTAAALGALGIAWVGLLLGVIDGSQLPIVAVAGFAGGQIDSVLGATLERDALRRDRPLGKQAVNFLASLLPAAVVFVAVATV